MVLQIGFQDQLPCRLALSGVQILGAMYFTGSAVDHNRHGVASLLAAHPVFTGEPVADMEEVAVFMDHIPEQGDLTIVLDDGFLTGCFLHGVTSLFLRFFLQFSQTH